MSRGIAPDSRKSPAVLEPQSQHMAQCHCCSPPSFALFPRSVLLAAQSHPTSHIRGARTVIEFMQVNGQESLI